MPESSIKIRIIALTYPLASMKLPVCVENPPVLTVPNVAMSASIGSSPPQISSIVSAIVKNI